MTRRTFAPLLFLLGLSAVLSLGAADDPSKKALQELGEFVGVWKGSADKVDGKASTAKETIEFGWKFDKGDSYIALLSPTSKVLAKGELRYDLKKKLYVLKATDKAGAATEYAGKLNKGKLVLENKTADGDVKRLTLYTLSDGARVIVQGDVLAGGKGLPSTEYKVAATKEGESFAGGGGKKQLCIVTEGLGTMPVSYAGKTYYVCCTGCKEEFEANPKKYVDEFEKKKGKK